MNKIDFRNELLSLKKKSDDLREKEQKTTRQIIAFLETVDENERDEIIEFLYADKIDALFRMVVKKHFGLEWK